MNSNFNTAFRANTMGARFHLCVLACLAAAVTVGTVGKVHAASATWTRLTPSGTYAWNSNTTPPWNTGLFPNAIGDDANLFVNYGNGINVVIELNETITLGSMSIGDSGTGTDRPVTINTGSGGTGFIFDNGSGNNASLTKGNAGATIVITPNITIPATTPNFNVTSTNGGLSLTGAITGSTNFNLSGSGSSVQIRGDITGFTGTFNITLGSNTVYFDGGAANTQDGSRAKFNISGTTTGLSGTLRWHDNSTDPSVPFKMGELSGTGWLRNEGPHLTTLQVGHLNTNSEFSGVIANGGQPPTLPGAPAEAVSFDKVGTGTLTLSGNNVYQGNTTVTGGTLLVNGTHVAGGGYAVNSGGTLGGTGTTESSVTVNSGGTLSPGASIESLGTGSVTFGSGSTLKYEINSTSVTADLLNAMSGSLTIGAGAALSPLDLGGSLLAPGTKFTVISYNGTWNGGTFAGAANLGLVNIGPKDFQIRYQDASPGGNFVAETGLNLTGRFVTLTAVPELGSFLTMGLVGCCAVGAVRLGKRYGLATFRV